MTTGVQIVEDDVLALDLPYRDQLRIRRLVFDGGQDGPMAGVVSGIHGDEIEGLYVCHRLAAWLERLVQERPRALRGRVELYPALNPLGLDTIDRVIPTYDVDLNRTFPGHSGGLVPQRIAAAVLRHLARASVVVDIHASNFFVR